MWHLKLRPSAEHHIGCLPERWVLRKNAVGCGTVASHEEGRDESGGGGQSRSAGVVRALRSPSDDRRRKHGPGETPARAVRLRPSLGCKRHKSHWGSERVHAQRHLVRNAPVFQMNTPALLRCSMKSYRPPDQDFDVLRRRSQPVKTEGNAENRRMSQCQRTSLPRTALWQPWARHEAGFAVPFLCA